MSTVAKGRCGERAAADYLARLGYRIIDRNFRACRGEVDLIAVSGEVLVFVEVKTWDTLEPRELERAIGRRKQMTITRCAKAFLSRHMEYDTHQVRFDVVLMRSDGTVRRHLVDAFAETGESW